MAGLNRATSLKALSASGFVSVSGEVGRRLLYAAVMILLVLVIGTVGYMLIEGWTSIDALYMTVITVATVGFHEVGTLSRAGRIFTMVLIFWGIGVGGYAIGTIAAFLVEGQMVELLKGRKMARVITGLKDHIIVCGYGKIGMEVCARLSAAEQSFIVIDRNPDVIDEALGLGYIAAVGEATDDEILEKAGIHAARGLISAISDDSANVYLVLTARALNDKMRIIARGVGEASCKKMLRAGADRVVSPYEIGARRMTALMLRPEIVEFLEAFAPEVSFGLRLEKVQLGESSSLHGVRLDHSYIKRDTRGAMVLAIEKTGAPALINPPGATLLEAGDVLLVIGSDEQLALLNKLVS